MESVATIFVLVEDTKASTLLSRFTFGALELGLKSLPVIVSWFVEVLTNVLSITTVALQAGATKNTGMEAISANTKRRGSCWDMANPFLVDKVCLDCFGNPDRKSTRLNSSHLGIS